jgi:hypothetical protein
MRDIMHIRNEECTFISYRFNVNELQNKKPHKTSKSGKKIKTKNAFTKDRKAHNHDDMKTILIAFKLLLENDPKKNYPNFHHFDTILLKMIILMHRSGDHL